jgi:hypothetical protein
MQKVLYALLTGIYLTSFVFADPTAETSDSDGESNELWPCDWVPHPSPPGGPSGPGEPKMA